METRPLAVGALVALTMLPPAPTAAAEPGARITARTPDRMLAQALARAGKAGALADLALAWTLADESAAGAAQRGLEAVGRGSGAIAEQARWLAAALDPAPAARPAGLLRNLAVLGPFRDDGGGLGRREGPEAAGQRWGDRRAAYDWGAYEVRWRAVPEWAVSARGVPLDLMIHPRRESCSYLATRVRVAAARTIVLVVASSGSVRLLWDGQDAGHSDEQHGGMVFDRLAAHIEATAGDHLAAVKVCSGPLDDRGRVRLRATDAAGGPLELATSADFQIAAPARPPGAGIKPLPTALARAVEVDASPAIERALAAALVRRLGGADDQRSPRAPGLLDSVATSPRATADLIAAAGWKAPFGTQRSGWLGLALGKALAAGDPETASFAERALALARARAGSTDWALATLARKPLADDDDDHARLVRATVWASLGIESLRRNALAELAGLAGRAGARAPAALWAHIASLARELDAGTRIAAADALAARLPERHDQEWVEARTRLSRAEVLQAVEAALATGGALSADALLGLGDILERAGLRPRAAALYEEVATLGPNKAAVHAALATTRYQRGDRAGGDRALARARTLDPNNTGYRLEESLRAPHAEPVAAGLLVDPKVFLERKTRDPVGAGKGQVYARTLHSLVVETLHPDRRVSQLVHYAREIVVEPRTQAELAEFVPQARSAEILRARVHRASGIVEPAQEQKIEQRRAVIRWRELKAGDVVEVAVRSWTDGPVGRRGDQPYAFVWPAGSTTSHPQLHAEVILESPVDMPLAHEVLHGQADHATDEVKDGRRVVRLLWDHPTNMADEPYGPHRTEVLPTVVASLHPRWEDFLHWYQDATEGFTEPDDQITRLARELTEGKTTRDEKVRAIFDYVANRIRYVNYHSGEWWLPNRPQQLLARRQGDCDDKAALLTSLLKATGIEAVRVLLQTRVTNMPSLLGAEHVALPAFDHGIAFLPGPAQKGGDEGNNQGIDNGQWLDATVPQTRVGKLSRVAGGAPTLLVRPGGAVMTTIPAALPADHGSDHLWKITLADSGAGELESEERYRGDEAVSMRQSLVQPDARAQVVERELGQWFSALEVDRQVDFDGNLPDGQVHLAYRARSDAFARRDRRDLVLPLSPPTTLTSLLAPLVKRTLPVVLPSNLAPNRETYEIRVIAPAGYRVGAPPRAGREAGGVFGEASLEIKRQTPRELVVRWTLTFGAATVPPEQYASWRRWLQQVDSLWHQSVRLLPVGSGTAKQEAS